MQRNRNIALRTVEEAKNSPLERVKALKERLTVAEAEIEARDAKISELQAKVEELSKANANLKAQYTRVKMAKAFAWDEKSKHAATLRINNILCEINRCIAQLEQDVSL